MEVSNDIKLEDIDFLNEKDISNKFTRKLSLLVALGPFTDGFNEIGASVAILAVAILYHPTPIIESSLLGAYWLGVGAGAFIGGWFGDIYGRKLLFVLDGLLMGIFALWSAFTYTELTFFIARLCLGFVIGIDYAVALPLMSEYSPTKKRGKFLSFVSIIFMVGTVVGSIVSVILELTIGDILAMRVIFIIGSIPAFVLFFLRLDMPESLRWAVDNDHRKKADAILAFLAKHKVIPSSYLSPQNREDLLNSFTFGKKNSFKPALKSFFNRRYIRPILYLMFMASMYSFAVNYLGIYGPVVYTQLGATATEAILITGLGYTGGMLGTLIPIFFVDKIGRVKMAIIGFAASLVIMIIYLVLLATKTLTLIDMFILDPIFLFWILGLVRTMAWVPSSEIGPTKARGLGQGWTKLWEFPTAFPAFIIYGIIGLQYSAIFAIGALIAGIVLVFIFGTETKGRTLEGIENDFENGGKLNKRILKESNVKDDNVER